MAAFGTAKPAPRETKSVDLVAGPVTTFEEACSRCHGPQGAFHGEELASLTDEKLREVVEKMMKGPSQLQPTLEQIEAMAAYQRSLRDRRPFLCVTNGAAFSAGRDIALRGEATPGSAVSLGKGETVLAASSEQFTWSVQNAPRPPFTVVAVHGETAIQLEYPAHLWSK